MTEIMLADQRFSLGPNVQCVKARWWSENTKCVVVDFVERPARPRGRPERSAREFSLRLDLDKAVFLDHFSDKTIDKMIQSGVLDIWRSIVTEKAKISRPD
jgi:hypothetical protein